MMDLPDGLGSRDRVLWAAASMLGEAEGAGLSVRAVAARAKVSTGSLRHHFPTQRALMDAVMALLADRMFPEVDVTDASAPPRERLALALHKLLLSEEDGDARTAWVITFDRYVNGNPSREAEAEYLSINAATELRLHRLLAMFEDEGALTPGDQEARTDFLMAVLTGLSVSRALPHPDLWHERQGSVLRAAVDAVFDTIR